MCVCTPEVYNLVEPKSKGNTEQAGCAVSAKAQTGLIDPKWVVKSSYTQI